MLTRHQYRTSNDPKQLSVGLPKQTRTTKLRDKPTPKPNVINTTNAEAKDKDKVSASPKPRAQYKLYFTGRPSTFTPKIDSPKLLGASKKSGEKPSNTYKDKVPPPHKLSDQSKPNSTTGRFSTSTPRLSNFAAKSKPPQSPTKEIEILRKLDNELLLRLSHWRLN